jgi:hypothetical protein
MNIRIKEFVSIGSDLLQSENDKKGSLKSPFFHYSNIPLFQINDPKMFDT